MRATYCGSGTRCVEKRRSLGNGLLEVLRSHHRPLLVNGCMNMYSRSNE
jgi:hypothetical protein